MALALEWPQLDKKCLARARSEDDSWAGMNIRLPMLGSWPVLALNTGDSPRRFDAGASNGGGAGDPRAVW